MQKYLSLHKEQIEHKNRVIESYNQALEHLKAEFRDNVNIQAKPFINLIIDISAAKGTGIDVFEMFKLFKDSNRSPAEYSILIEEIGKAIVLAKLNDPERYSRLLSLRNRMYQYTPKNEFFGHAKKKFDV